MSGVVDLMEATVQLEQPLPDGQRTIGAGFVVSATDADGRPRAILVTAHHVFARMPGDRAKVGFRTRDEAGGWRFAPLNVRIRGAEGEPLWTQHPTQDVAAIELPASLSAEGVPVAELPGERALANLRVEPGDQMMALGFPHGYAANPAGFPILRAGQVASYPLSPADRYPTYLLDFSVFAGNSGGPVFIVLNRHAQAASGGQAARAVITGMLTQQVKVRGDRLEIGNVTQADFITETISLLDGHGPAEVSVAQGVPMNSDPVPAAAGQAPSPRMRLAEAWDALVKDLEILVRRLWIVARDMVADLASRDPRRL